MGGEGARLGWRRARRARRHALVVDDDELDATSRLVSTSSSSRVEQHVTLVVEDDPVWRRLLVHRLGAMGHVVVDVPHAEGALGWIGAHGPPRLVCLDLSLPEMSGFGLCEQLRAHARTRDVPVIVVTARTSLEDRTLALEVGADAFFEKPVRWAAFEAEVDALLRRPMPSEGAPAVVHVVSEKERA